MLYKFTLYILTYLPIESGQSPASDRILVHFEEKIKHFVA